MAGPLVRMKINGMDRVLKGINRRVRVLPERAVPRLEKIALRIIWIAVQLTPVDTGNLRRSAGHEIVRTTSGPVLLLYYQASYAPYVHERVEAFHRPPTRAKFLETPIKDERDWIIETLAGNLL